MPTNPLASPMPNVFIRSTFTPLAPAMEGLLPVIRMAMPRSVLKKRETASQRTAEMRARHRHIQISVASPGLMSLQVGEEGGLVQERDVGATHDVQVHRVEARHYQDAGQEPVHAEPRVDQCGDDACDRRDQKPGRQGGDGACAGRDEHGGDSGAGRETAVHRDVREVIHPEGDEDPHGHEGIQEAETDGADPEFHCLT